MNNFLSNRVMMGAAIVGIVGAAGIYLYEQLVAEKRRAMLVREMARLDRQVTSMRTELEALRELQKESNVRRQKHKRRVLRENNSKVKPAAAGGDGDQVDAPEVSYASDSEYFSDYHSVVGTDTDMDSEEFYDVHSEDDDDDDDTLQESLRNQLSNGSSDIEQELSDKADALKISTKSST